MREASDQAAPMNVRETDPAERQLRRSRNIGISASPRLEKQTQPKGN